MERMANAMLYADTMVDDLKKAISPLTTEAKFDAWGGEVEVIIHINNGIYGHRSAVMVTRHIDNPMVAYTYDGYHKLLPRVEQMHALYNWIADTMLAHILKPGEDNPDQAYGDLAVTETINYNPNTDRFDRKEW